MEKKKVLSVFLFSLLGTVAGNCMYNYFRDKATEKRKEMEFAEWSSTFSSENDVPDIEGSTADAITKDESAEQEVQNSTETNEMAAEAEISEMELDDTESDDLTENEKLVLKMHKAYNGDMTSEEMANATGIGKSTINTVRRNLRNKGYTEKQFSKKQRLTKAKIGMVDSIIAEYGSSKTNVEIAKIADCSEETVRRRKNVLRESGRLSA